MPDVKLTLKLDAEVIARGKEYARRHGTSLSRLVERELIGAYSAGQSEPLPKPSSEPTRFKAKEEIQLSDEVRALMPATVHQGIDWSYDEMRAIYYQDREHSHSPR